MLRFGASLKSLRNTRKIFTNCSLFEESNSNDGNDKPPNNLTKKEEASKKLNDLIKEMAQKSTESKLASNIKIPKPREKRRKQELELKKKIEKQIEKEDKEQLANLLTEAATQVAESIGGDTKKTEMELLDLYLSRHRSKDSETDTSSSNLNELLSDMKVEKEVDPSERFSRAEQVKTMKAGRLPQQFSRRPTRDFKPERVNLYGEQPFNIFDPDKIKEKNVTPLTLTTWDHFHQRDLKLLVTHPPKNIFEQLILWTEQGKIWRFPIDNEQDWHEEEKYDFSDHVFLERWLEPWCPATGPIRHFMELVCTGLSKNPYLTVPEKQAHIFWYEHYFRSKKELLQDTGAGEILDRPQVEKCSA